MLRSFFQRLFSSISIYSFLTLSLPSLFAQQQQCNKYENYPLAMYQEIPVPHNSRKAVFGVGCFWGPDGEFPGLHGVYRTTVGYAGGEQANPTYRNIMDHTEVIEIEYCPDEITYQQLLKKFWNCNDNMYTRHGKRQYISLILYGNEEEKKLAEKSYEEVKEAVNRLSPVNTEIRKLDKFYAAEDYHQKYHLQHDPELMAFFGVTPKIIVQGSTVAAKLSAIVMGYGEQSEVEWMKSKIDMSLQQYHKLSQLVKIGES